MLGEAHRAWRDHTPEANRDHWGGWDWSRHGWGTLIYPDILRVVIPSVVAIIVGFQVMLAAFFLSVLMINHK